MNEEPTSTMYTREEILEAIAGLERDGRIEWTGEWRPARDGTLRKVYRATKNVH